MNNKNSAPVFGVFVFLLGILFIILKLVHVIDWPWWLVTLPIWGGLVFYLFILLIVAVIFAVVKSKY